MDIKNSYFIAGGALPPDTPVYVKRAADDELFNSILAGQFCYVSGPHQIGKSSLMVRTDARLRQQQVRTAIIYLSGIDASAGLEQWYLGLLTRLKLRLNLTIDVEAWWADQVSLKPSQRWLDFCRYVVLAEITDPLVIFIDEVETALNLAFAGDFWAALRALHDARPTEPIFQRLTFVLLGTTTPTDLIKEADRSPFAVAKLVDLPDFRRGETQVLEHGLAEIYPEQCRAIFSRIFYWTNGHPYLTQKLCLEVSELNGWQWPEHQAGEAVDRLVEKFFLAKDGPADLNLLALLESLSHYPQRRRLIALYRQIYSGKEVPEDAQSFDQIRLKLLGLVRPEEGYLKVRNMIYRQVFNISRLKIKSSSNWHRYIMLTFIILVVIVTAVLSFSIYQQVQHIITAQAQPLIESLGQTTKPDERLDNLAGLFNLPGYQEQAQSSFFELNPAEQIALFDQVDPYEAGAALVTVIKGVYTAPNLQNNEQDNALLYAMAGPMRALIDDPALPDAVSLELEITQWLKGREAYNQGQYQQAIAAYNRAIELNNQNPGIYFDRALAYSAQGEPSLALPDLSSVTDLNEDWQPRVQQALNGDSQLYNALWSEQETYQNLVVLVPTPTNTPTPTHTSTPTPTPTSTGTATPHLLTATPTPTLKPTRVPTLLNTPSAPVTSTPGLPAGTITLVSPLLEGEPTYGVTKFRWQWSSSLPPQYGFEVRVWREGGQPAGVHNAVLDNQNGNIKNLGNNTYELGSDITDAFGVKGQSGEYWWTVALVRISPKYADMGLQASPGQLRFAAPGSSGGGGKGDGGGGGVGIE